MAEIQILPETSGADSKGKVPNKPRGNESSRRFRWAMWVDSEHVVQRPEVVGLENLEKIPKGINPVIAGTHLRTDTALQIIAREIDEKFDIGIAQQAGNRKNPIINTMFTIIGQDHFYDVDHATTWSKVNGKSERDDKYMLNFNNYDVMNEAMKKGKTILIAAHYSPIYNGILPNKPGFAAIYLAHLSGQRVILPVALEIKTEDPDTGRADRSSNVAKKLLTGNRPKSKMTICEPITLDPIDPANIELMKRWLTARQDQKPSGLTSEEHKKAKETFRRMRQDGEKVMYALAKALPPERRGVWNKEPAGE